MSYAYHLGKHVEANSDDRGVCTVMLKRDDGKANALTQEMMKELTEVLKNASNTEGVKIIVLRSGLKDIDSKKAAFCKGIDLQEMKQAMELPNRTKKEERDRQAVNREQCAMLSTLFTTLAECKKPKIGVASGSSSGAGTTILRLCDYVVADRDHATFSYPEVNFGMMPSISGVYVIPHMAIGAQRGFENIRECFGHGRLIHPLKGKEWKIFDEVCAASEIDERVEQAIQKIFAGKIRNEVAERFRGNDSKITVSEALRYIKPLKGASKLEKIIEDAMQDFMGVSRGTHGDFRKKCIENLTKARCEEENLDKLNRYLSAIKSKQSASEIESKPLEPDQNPGLFGRRVDGEESHHAR